MLGTTSFDCWQREENATKLVTLFKELDNALGGGLTMGKITEFCGASGSGKTQMCLQLCLTVQFPKDVGGLNGKALYIDTNQDFHPLRLREIAECMELRFQNTSQKLSVDSLLDNISYVYCANYIELLATIINMRETLSEQPTLKVIIIDSFAHSVRHIEDGSQRIYIIYKILTKLRKLAMDFELAVIITNELTTTKDVSNEDWQICPALGIHHSHKINERIILTKDSSINYHIAFIDKSVVTPRIAIRFEIKRNGIRSISS